jgi:hypothetical protein
MLGKLLVRAEVKVVVYHMACAFLHTLLCASYHHGKKAAGENTQRQPWVYTQSC